MKGLPKLSWGPVNIVLRSLNFGMAVTILCNWLRFTAPSSSLANSTNALQTKSRC